MAAGCGVLVFGRPQHCLSWGHLLGMHSDQCANYTSVHPSRVMFCGLWLEQHFLCLLRSVSLCACPAPSLAGLFPLWKLPRLNHGNRRQNTPFRPALLSSVRPMVSACLHTVVCLSFTLEVKESSPPRWVGRGPVVEWEGASGAKGLCEILLLQGRVCSAHPHRQW